MPSYRTALIESRGELRDGDRAALEELTDVPPKDGCPE
jgi:hypothetical protein